MELPFPPAIVLVAPQMGENIGAAARAMHNFGLTDLRLVNPRDGWPNSRASAVAAGADAVLERATVHASVAGAVAECDLVLAATARGREQPKPSLAPREAVQRLRENQQQGGRGAVLFGSERTGLENADVLCARALIRIPATAAFRSLNLAQAVVVLAYEWGCAIAEPLPVTRPESLEAGPAQQAREHLVAHLVEALDRVGYFRPAEKRAASVAALTNLFGRIPVTDSEIRMLRGVIHALGRERPGARTP